MELTFALFDLVLGKKKLKLFLRLQKGFFLKSSRRCFSPSWTVCWSVSGISAWEQGGFSSLTRMGAKDLQSILWCSMLFSASAQGTDQHPHNGDSLWVTHLVKLQLLYKLRQTLSFLRNLTITAYQIPENNSNDQLCRSEGLWVCIREDFSSPLRISDRSFY